MSTSAEEIIRSCPTPPPGAWPPQSSAANKPAFRSAYKKLRCLIPADGFYEWKRDEKVKQPYHIHMNDGSLFALAGLWETWQRTDSCAILTTEANDLVRDVHDRMPVILASDDYGEWLVGDTIPLLPYPVDRLAMTPVSRRVNSPAYDGPECLEGRGQILLRDTASGW